MSAINPSGRRGNTIVPNWRWEDTGLDTYMLRIAGWLASHAGHYRESFVTRNEIARRTGISGPKVSSSIARLNDLGITKVDASHPRGWVITFDFDAWEGREGGSVAPGSGSGATAEGGSLAPATRGNPEMGENQEILPSPLRAEVVMRDDFDLFWMAYPRHVGKDKARTAFTSAIKRGATIARMLATIGEWGPYWLSGDPKFIPHPATWLNQGRWDDDPPPQRTPDSKVHPTDLLLSNMRRVAQEARDARR